MVGAIIGGVASLYGAVSSSDASSNASDNQKAAMDEQAQVAQNQLDFSKQQYSDWKQMYQPAITQMGSMAMQQIHPDYGAIAADVGSAYDSSNDIQSRNLERMGVKPTDGAYQTQQTQYGLGRALATVAGDQNARQNAQQQQWNRLAGFAGMGANQQGAVSASMSNSANGLANVFGQQASMYGNLAGMYGQSAMAGAGMFGRSLAGIGGMFGAGGQFGSAVPMASADIPGPQQFTI